MGRLDDYLDLIERERECRPSEAMLADEIHRLRSALDAAVHNSTVFMSRIKGTGDHYEALGWERHQRAFAALHPAPTPAR